MTKQPDNSKTKQNERPPIRLPFQASGSEDFGVWSYNHRRGIYATLIAYLLFGIAFMAFNINIGGDSQSTNMIIDLNDPDQKRMVLTPEQIELIEHGYDLSSVQNLISNQGAEYGSGGAAGAGLNAALQDDRGTVASDIYGSAEQLDDQMRSNKEAYERGLQQASNISNRDRAGTSSEREQGAVGERAADSRVKGLVTVLFSFENPVRKSVSLVVPAYMCEGGGKIVVDVTLDTNGNVSATSVNRSLSSTDECMQSTAMYASRSSSFNVDATAPSRHRGTITYIFIPQ